jgi:hypothetical protein
MNRPVKVGRAVICPPPGIGKQVNVACHRAAGRGLPALPTMTDTRQEEKTNRGQTAAILG